MVIGNIYWYGVSFLSHFLFQLRDVRKAEQASNPYYVKSSSHTNALAPHLVKTEDIPIESLYMNVPLKIQGKLTT